MKPSGLAAVVVALATGGCAALRDGDLPRNGPVSPEVRACSAWFAELDAETDAAGVRDAQYARIAGFRYLRTDRFLASLGAVAARYPAAMEAWRERLAQRDLEARRHEIANLPRERLDRLPAAAGMARAEIVRHTQECARLLRENDDSEPGAASALVARARVPDDYSDVARMVGLYPITKPWVARGARRWEAEAAARFRDDAPPASGQIVVRYSPPPAALPHAVAAGMLGRASLDALGMPILSPREVGLLAAAYAPDFEVVISADYDRFGELRWRRGGKLPEVEGASVAVYINPAYTRYGDRILLQLVYTIWFPERPAESRVDLLAGALDALVWRVTLAPDGEPLIYDSIHGCGCYHQFFPTPRARVRAAPDDLDEWAFVPEALPVMSDGARPVVRVASATHYIEKVRVVTGQTSLARYTLQPYDDLRSLPSMDGGSRSAFGPDGIIRGTERLERWILWPMGIESAGAMRQWGRHATAFVGRRHFDDPDLLEKRFELDLGERLP